MTAFPARWWRILACAYLNQQGGAADQEDRRRDAYAPAPGAPEQHPGTNHEKDDDNRVSNR